MTDAELRRYWSNLGCLVAELRVIGHGTVADTLVDAVRAAATSSEILGQVGAVLRDHSALRPQLSDAGSQAWDAILIDVGRGFPATHIGKSSHRPWVPAVALLGIGYALVGIAFAIPVTYVPAWRGAAWVVSAVGYGAHIAYERFERKSSPGPAALHVALAVALGAFGLAVGANLHSLSIESTSQHRRLLLLSLGIWPVMTALPAFLVALGANLILERALGSLARK